MDDDFPDCAILKPASIGSDSKWERQDTDELTVSPGIYRIIDHGHIDHSDIAGDDTPTEERCLDEEEAQMIDEFARTLEESSAEFDESTAPEWYERD